MSEVRSRMDTLGVASLLESELLDVLFGGESGDGQALQQAVLQQRMSQAPIDPELWRRLQAWEALKLRWWEGAMRREPLLNSGMVQAYLTQRIGGLRCEQILALYLDSRLHLVDSQVLSVGTVNEARLYPRELVRGAIENSATHLVLAHNHPSGQQRPSAADLGLTQHVESILAGVNITLVDHFVVTALGIESIKHSNKAA